MFFLFKFTVLKKKKGRAFFIQGQLADRASPGALDIFRETCFLRQKLGLFFLFSRVGGGVCSWSGEASSLSHVTQRFFLSRKRRRKQDENQAAAPKRFGAPAAAVVVAAVPAAPQYAQPTAQPVAVVAAVAPPPPPPPRAPQGMVEVVAQFDFPPDQPGDLGFAAGDLITTDEAAFHASGASGGWITGELNGKTGSFPSNYVALP